MEGPKTDYFFVGLEARLRNSNKFFSLAEAIRVAGQAAKHSYVPCRIFAMLPTKHAKLMGFVDESGTFTETPDGYTVW